MWTYIEEKNVEFNRAAFGLIGLETALGLVLTKLVAEKKLTLKEAIAKMTINPAKILNLTDKGSLKPGSDADVIIIDPKAKWKVNPEKFSSKSKNSPFIDWELQGKVIYTIVGGKMVVKDAQII